jgi:superfamily II DNA or RNA helicase
MDSDTLAKLKINCLVLKYKDEERKVVSKTDYQSEVDYIVAHPRRNNLIANLAIDQKHNTLLLFNYVDKHGKPLYELIKKKLGPDSKRKVYFVSGEVNAMDREDVRSNTELEKDAIIVGSIGTFSVGVNIRNLATIIFASPTKSQIRVLQSIGRGLRKCDDGKPTTLFDLCDDFAWKKKKNYTLNHALERVRIYDSERFDYKTFEVPMT